MLAKQRMIRTVPYGVAKVEEGLFAVVYALVSVSVDNIISRSKRGK